MNTHDRNTLAITLGILGFTILGVSFLQVRDADAQGKPAVEKVKRATKEALKQGLTVDIDTLEAQARSAHDALQVALTQVRESEAAMVAAAVGSAEADAASESWLKAQGVALAAQDTLNTAMRELESGRRLKGEAATAFVEERCGNDDGKDADVKRVCDRLAAAKAEAAAREAANAARVAESAGPVLGP